MFYGVLATSPRVSSATANCKEKKISLFFDQAIDCAAHLETALQNYASKFGGLPTGTTFHIEVANGYSGKVIIVHYTAELLKHQLCTIYNRIIMLLTYDEACPQPLDTHALPPKLRVVN